MTVRKARAEDIPEIAELHVASVRQLGASQYRPDQIEAWSSPRAAEHYQARIETGLVYVAEADGHVIGFSQLSPGNDEVTAVYVHPDHTRAGVGSALLAALEATARLAGVAALHLDSSLNAVRFYAAKGFSPVEDVQHQLRGGTPLECVRMVKQL